MILSPLQLEFCYVESLRWKVEPEYEPQHESQLALEDMQSNIERSDETDDGRTAAYRLTLCLPPAGTRYPYSFEIVIVASFVLDASVPNEQVVPILDTNAPAMLYSTAREVLATTLGRGPFRPLMLPSVHFLDLKREPLADTPDATPAKVAKTALSKPRKSRRMPKATADS